MDIDGETYMLHTSASVRQSVEHFSAQHGPLKVISESILDLESSQRSTACEVRDALQYHREDVSNITP